MYTFSNKLKTFSIALIILGLLGVGYSFMNSHKTFEDVETMLAEEAHHGGGHGEEAAHVVEASQDTHVTENNHAEDSQTTDADAHVDEHSKHVEHVQHQIANRPWAALYVAAFFFMMIALGVLAFYAIQWASQSGWSPVLFRVMEGITAYLLPGALIVLGIAAASHYLGHNNIFIWMDPELVNPDSEHFDKLINNKKGWLDIKMFMLRGLIFIAGWSLYRYFARKFSIAQDNADDNRNFKKTFRISAAFLVFFIYTESMMSWDWIMSVDPNWFST